MKKFSSETNGYNREEVNDFIKEVIQETEGMTDKYREQEETIKRLQEEINQYQKLETSIKDAVQVSESERIIADAKKDASEIINEALRSAEEIDAQRRILEKNMEILKKKLKLIVEQQMVIVEKNNELEIKE